MNHTEGQTDVDDEKKYTVTEGLDEVERQGTISQPETIRALKGRQMSMIAIGGAIGKLDTRLRRLDDWQSNLNRNRSHYWFWDELVPLRTSQSSHCLHYHGCCVSEYSFHQWAMSVDSLHRCLGVMCALGEMSTRYPTKKGFAGHATRCVDEAFGFATALVYLCKVRSVFFHSPTDLIMCSISLRAQHRSSPSLWSFDSGMQKSTVLLGSLAQSSLW
jgi:hypothetical protein